MSESTPDGGPPRVGVIMGSKSDWETMRHAVETLETLAVPHETRVVSAHRTPDLLFDYAGSAADRGLEVIIAGAGGAAAGIPVGTLAIGRAGAVNAGLLAASIVGLRDADVRGRLEAWRQRQTDDVLAHPDPRPETADS